MITVPNSSDSEVLTIWHYLAKFVDDNEMNFSREKENGIIDFWIFN